MVDAGILSPLQVSGVNPKQMEGRDRQYVAKGDGEV
jgi:hypothetical protein